MSIPGNNQTRSSLLGFASAAGSVLAVTLFSWLFFGRDQLPDVMMLYLLAVVVVGARFGRAASLLATVLAIGCANVVFIPPYWSIAVSELRHVVMFGVMFVVAIVISGLTRERIRLSSEARRAALEVEAERLRSSLLSSISHDLRTPLGVIIGATSSLLGGDDKLAESSRRDLLMTAHQEAERLNRLVNNLLQMTQLSAGPIRVQRSWHPVDEIVGVALARLDQALQDHPVTIDVSAELPPIAVDDVLFEQALINVIENAVKYSPANSPIHIEAAHAAGELTLSVADHGPGIREPDRARVFEKFQRLDVAPGGAGLGLAIAHGIVKAHGGRIWIDDNPGGGARFNLVLPSSSAPELPEATEEAPD